jgi:molybdenum cofactor biosynthesis protein B
MTINNQKEFKPINIAVLTISDTRDEASDRSGQTLAKKILEKGHKVFEKTIIKDEVDEIVKKLNSWCNDSKVDVIITTGGTGVTGRDVTPEALEKIKDKDIPGFGELFRLISYKKIGTSTIQSRALAVLSKGKYIFALPGSTGAVTDAWEEILKFQLDSRFSPCNFIDLIPRLKEK